MTITLERPQSLSRPVPVTMAVPMLLADPACSCGHGRSLHRDAGCQVCAEYVAANRQPPSGYRCGHFAA